MLSLLGTSMCPAAKSKTAACTDLLWCKLQGCKHEEDADWQAQYVTEVHIWILGQGAVQQPGGTVGKDAHKWHRVQLLQVEQQQAQ